MTAPTVSTSAASSEAAAAPRRAFALDALRGLAILMMVLSGVVPPELPAWMHHAQVPPPEMKFNPNLPGITWVDLVFPFFLFSMGAAIPLALSRRLDKGYPAWRAVLTAFQRFLLLGLFAAYVPHIRPFAITPAWPVPDATWWRGLACFAVLFPILLRLPETWPLWQRYAVRAAGWAGAIALMATLRLPDGKGFTWENNDIIIRILANVVVGASVVWLVTRKNWTLRLGSLLALFAIRMATSAEGANWVKAIWDWKPPYLDWLWSLGMWSLLFVAIPGTIAGDLLLAWMRPSSGAEPEADERPAWTDARLIGVAAAAFAATPVALWGLFTRHVTATVGLSALLGAALFALTAHAKTGTERLLRAFVQWGVFCLMLGLAFEPYEGGIKKDPATMSYYFVTAGLAFLLMVTFTIVIDVYRGRKAMALLIGNGQNPMIAYIGLTNLVQPILFLTGINLAINRLTEGHPMWVFWHGAAATLLLAVIVYGLSRAKIFWRT